MKFAKLVLFFSINFLIIFALMTCFRFLSLRIEWAKILPVRPESTLTLMLTAAHWALSLALFCSILIAINYVVRRSYNAIIAIPSIIFLTLAFTFCFSFVLNQWSSVPPARVQGISLGGKGLILSNSLNRNVTAVVLLEGTDNPLGPRVTSIPGQPLILHETTSANFSLPPVPFGDDTPWFLKSISIDVRLNAEMFQRKYSEGILSFLLYSGSLIFMLCSLGFAVKFSVWPLANLFIATLAFRGILAFNTFFNTPEMQEILDSFWNKMLPASVALPLLFICFGILINMYSFLVYASKRRDDDDL